MNGHIALTRIDEDWVMRVQSRKGTIDMGVSVPQRCAPFL